MIKSNKGVVTVEGELPMIMADFGMIVESLMKSGYVRKDHIEYAIKIAEEHCEKDAKHGTQDGEFKIKKIIKETKKDGKK